MTGIQVYILFRLNSNKLQYYQYVPFDENLIVLSAETCFVKIIQLMKKMIWENAKSSMTWNKC